MIMKKKKYQQVAVLCRDFLMFLIKDLLLFHAQIVAIPNYSNVVHQA